MSQSTSSSALGVTGGVLAVGLSGTVQLPAINSQVAVTLQWLVGQTLWIHGSSASPGGTGYIWGQTTMPVYRMPEYRGSLYFSAGGVTALISWQKELDEVT